MYTNYFNKFSFSVRECDFGAFVPDVDGVNFVLLFVCVSVL